MAVHIRAQVRWPQSTALPEDVVCINPCFRNNLAAPGWDADGLAQDLADGIADWQFQDTDPVEVRLYDIQGTKPVYPMAVAHANPGAAAGDVSQPTETAVCLSFFGDHNEPRKRGRLYIPFYKVAGKDGLDRKVNNGYQLIVAQLVPLFAGLGGADIDWIVWSGRSNAAHKVEHWFVDDAWDTVRSRGRKATSRLTGDTGG
jgi:hypothetical protein